MNDNQSSERKVLGKLQNIKFCFSGRNAEVRDKGDSESDACQIDQEIVAAKFDFRDEIEMGFLEKGMEEFAGGTFLVQHHDRQGLELFQCDFTAFQREMVWVGYENIAEFVNGTDILCM